MKAAAVLVAVFPDMLFLRRNNANDKSPDPRAPGIELSGPGKRKTEKCTGSRSRFPLGGGATQATDRGCPRFAYPAKHFSTNGAPMHWPHKDLLCVSQLTPAEILYVFRMARRFAEINTRPVKKVPTLKGKSVILFFVEPSTRTKTSFDIAGKRLSADTYSLAASSSSLRKGENLKDSGLTLQAMHPDALVLRHQQSGASEFLARRLSCSVINAGDGWHAHPTQALLDGFALSAAWGDDMAGKSVLIVGDIAHSRVARSDVQLFTALGAQVRICAPRTLLPAGIRQWPVEIFSDLTEACRDVDAVICLRLQLERQKAGLLPDPREYARTYGLGARHLNRANPGVLVMHPGPMNRGVEIDAALADAENSLILDQVSAGVATRMALLFLFLTRKDASDSADARDDQAPSRQPQSSSFQED